MSLKERVANPAQQDRAVPLTQTTHVFFIEADADANVFSRVANQFNYANVAPSRVTLHEGAAGTLRMEVELRGVRPATAESICRKLEQLTCVVRVRFSGSPQPRGIAVKG